MQDAVAMRASPVQLAPRPDARAEGPRACRPRAPRASPSYGQTRVQTGPAPAVRACVAPALVRGQHRQVVRLLAREAALGRVGRLAALQRRHERRAAGDGRRDGQHRRQAAQDGRKHQHLGHPALATSHNFSIHSTKTTSAAVRHSGHMMHSCIAGPATGYSRHRARRAASTLPAPCNSERMTSH